MLGFRSLYGSVHDFFVGAHQVRRITRNSADKMSTKQLKRNLKTANLPTSGSREELIARYDKFIRDTLVAEGMSSPSEREDDEGPQVEQQQGVIEELRKKLEDTEQRVVM